MSFTIIGKANGTDSWYRLDEPEHVQKPAYDDVIQIDDDVYRVGGGYGFRPKHLYLIANIAENDFLIDAALEEERDYQQTIASFLAGTR